MLVVGIEIPPGSLEYWNRVLLALGVRMYLTTLLQRALPEIQAYVAEAHEPREEPCVRVFFHLFLSRVPPILIASQQQKLIDGYITECLRVYGAPCMRIEFNFQGTHIFSKDMLFQ